MGLAYVSFYQSVTWIHISEYVLATPNKKQQIKLLRTGLIQMKLMSLLSVLWDEIDLSSHRKEFDGFGRF